MGMDVLHYQTTQGTDPFQDWLDGIKDLKGRVAILRRLDRMAAGNFGDYKFERDGVWELRVDLGPGYRVYYSREGDKLILLLGGGSKRSQTADITDAVTRLNDYRRRTSCLVKPKTR
jgi:putative addiction module killer protein